MLPEPPTQPHASTSWHRDRIVRFDLKHNLGKVKNVDALLSKYASQEDDVFSKMC